MPGISKRGQIMPDSPIRKLVPYEEIAIEKGLHVHHLNIGQPDLPPSDTSLEALKKADLSVIGYSHSAGNKSYRKKLAEYYQKVGLDINYDEILITTGGSEAIAFSFLCCLNPGDEIIMPEPFYANYRGFATYADVKIKPITSRIEDGFSLPPMEEFEKHITNKTKGIFICNPNNPTGYLYSEDEIRTLGRLVKKYDLYLFADEVYRTLCYVDDPFFSVMQLEGMEEHVVMLDSASKRYNACGLRVGAMITKNKKVHDTAMKFAQARLSPPHFGQVAGEAALDSSNEYLDMIYKTFKERRDFIVDGLNKIPGVFCPPPKGAFYVMAKLPVDDTEVFAKWLLKDFSYNNQTVMLAPASGFYITPGLGKQEVRMAYVIKREAIKLALECLEEALKVYPGRIE
jgi:aspartate aminotransferase